MKKIKSAHILLIIIALVQLVFTSGIGILVPDISTGLLLLLSQISIIIPFVIYCIIKKENPLKVIRLKKIKFHTIILSVLVVLFSYPIIALLNMVSMIFVDNAVLQVMPDIVALGLPLGLTLMAIMPAIFEETIFRGMLYNTYSKNRPIAGIILSALLFGLMHQNFNQMPYAFFLGLILALMLEASDTIIAPMIMHFTLNGISTITSFLSADTLVSEVEMSMDFKSIIQESLQMSMAETGMMMTEEELNAMIPVVMGVMIAVFLVMALISLAIVCALIYAAFRLNKRRPKEVFGKNRTQIAYVEGKNGAIVKNKMFDIWLIIFIIYTIGMCILSIFI